MTGSPAQADVAVADGSGLGANTNSSRLTRVVWSRNRKVKSGHRVVLRPSVVEIPASGSRPVDQTEPSRPAWSSRLKRSCASARGSAAQARRVASPAAPRPRSGPGTRSCGRSSCGRARCWGPAGRTGWGSRRRWCRGAPASLARCPDLRSRSTPSRPVISTPVSMSWTWKPVPWMIASTSISRPSAVTMPRSVTRSIPSVSTSTLSRFSAG